MKEKHMFAGVNSPGGFVSRFDQIMPEIPGGRKIFIKGGPGTGKSTLMKKIIKRAADEGLYCEVFHCSSDPSSIDGVHIPARKTSIIDATAPHNSDPLYPGICGEILDVSLYIQKEKMQGFADEITELTKRKKHAFLKGYHLLSAALPLLRQTDDEYMDAISFSAVCAEANKLANSIFGHIISRERGEVRKLFLSAITPEGFINYIDASFDDSYVIAVRGKVASSIFIKRFAEVCQMRGFDTVLFHCPMRPNEKIEHIYIPKFHILLTVYDDYTHAAADEFVDLSDYIDSPSEDSGICGLTATLITQAIEAFKEAKAAHAELEKKYIPSMDFDALEIRGQEMIRSIF